MRIIALVMLCVMVVPAWAGAIPSDERAEMIDLVFAEGYWGIAMLRDGSRVHPESEEERTRLPISRALADRVIDAGELSGLAKVCNVPWQAFTLSLADGARRRGMAEKQVAFITVLHDVTQAYTGKLITHEICDAETRDKLATLMQRSAASYVFQE